MQNAIPLAHSRVWRNGQVIDDDVSPDDMIGVAQDPDCLVWLDLVKPSESQMREIASHFHISETAAEDALAPHERPKLSVSDTHAFFTVYATHMHAADTDTGERLTTHRISGIVLPKALVTIRLDDAVDMTEIVRRWDENPDLTSHGPSALVHGLLDVVVDGHFEAIQALDESLDTLEDALFEDRTPGREFQVALYGLRKDLVRLRRITLPMREVVNGVVRHTSGDGALRAWYEDLYDHVLRASEWTESLRDLVASIFETNLALADARLNTVTKKLAAWAAIIAVPTAITGWFGQNIPYPGYDKPSGLFLSTALIIVTVALLYVVFRRKDWL